MILKRTTSCFYYIAAFSNWAMQLLLCIHDKSTETIDILIPKSGWKKDISWDECLLVPEHKLTAPIYTWYP